MLDDHNRRHVLKQAAASLDQVAEGLADVHVLINGRLATFEQTTEAWSSHPELPHAQLRRIPSPPGAAYHLLEVRSPAGTESTECQVSHATDVHVLAGLVLIDRPGRAQQEYYPAGTCTQFAAGEKHTCTVLQDAHRLVIFHTPNPHSAKDANR